MNRLSLLHALSLGLALSITTFTASLAHACSSTAQGFGCTFTNAPLLSDLPGVPYTGSFGTPWESGLQTDATELSKLFGVRPALLYIQESGTGPNAFSTNRSFPELVAQSGRNPSFFPDGTVFIGLDLIRAEAQATQGGLYSLPAILAHEFAHTMQARRNCPLSGKARELHADFMAGYFVRHRMRYYPQDISQAVQALWNRGDYAFNEPSHHGTPQERAGAFLAGVHFNEMSAFPSGPAAYDAGMSYIQNYAR